MYSVLHSGFNLSTYSLDCRGRLVRGPVLKMHSRLESKHLMNWRKERDGDLWSAHFFFSFVQVSREGECDPCSPRASEEIVWVLEKGVW